MIKLPFLQKNKIVSRGKVERVFDYEKNGTTLRFTLRTDIKDQLKNFRELLKVAMSDVEEELNKHQ